MQKGSVKWRYNLIPNEPKWKSILSNQQSFVVLELWPKCNENSFFTDNIQVILCAKVLHQKIIHLPSYILISEAFHLSFGNFHSFMPVFFSRVSFCSIISCHLVKNSKHSGWNTQTFSFGNSFPDAWPCLFICHQHATTGPEAFYQAAVRRGSSFDRLNEGRRLSVWVTVTTNSACAHAGIHLSRGLLGVSITTDTKLRTEKTYNI